MQKKAHKLTTRLLSRSSLLVYVLVIFIFNITVGQFDINRIFAAVDASTLYSLHNSNRSANGLPELTVNQLLVESATNKAKAMLDADCWSHYCPDGTPPWSFILNTGYEYVHAGENLGEGFTTSSTIMNAWMNSPTHRDNVLSGNFTEIGIGFAYGSFQGNPNNTVVVVHFGSRGEEVPVTPPTTTPTPIKSVQSTIAPAKPTIAPKATGVPDSTSLKITSPSANSVLNTSKPKITGTKPITSEVEFFIDNISIGTYISRDSSFEFIPQSNLSDGAKSLTIKSFVNNRLTATTETVNFFIDTQPPKIIEDSLTIDYLNEDIKLSFKTDSKADKASLNSSININSVTDNIWEVTIKKTDLQEDKNLIILAIDNAGNTSTLEIPYSFVKDKSQDLVEDNFQTSQTISGSLVAGVNDIKTSINFVFLIFLLSLFGVDFYLLHKSGLTGVKKNKSHLNLSMTVVIIIVLLLGGVGGSIM